MKGKGIDTTTNIRRIVINLRKKRNIRKMAVINGQSKKKKNPQRPSKHRQRFLTTLIFKEISIKIIVKLFLLSRFQARKQARKKKKKENSGPVCI